MHDRSPTGDEAGHPAGEAETSVELLQRAREGDRAAEERLFARYMGPLRRWAGGRLPRWARDVLDTDDLVQETLLKTARNLEHFECRRSGGFHAYLRQALKNRIRDELQRAARRPAAEPLKPGQRHSGASPLEETIGRETLERYEAALARLGAEEREAVVARIEMGLTYGEIAPLIGGRSANAVRVMVSRALVRIAKEIGDEA